MSDVAHPPPGWYSDPGGSGGRRYWDGATWTQQTDPGAPTPAPYAPAAGEMIPPQSRQWALAAHLSGLVGLLSGVFGFVGPLVVYFARAEDPWVRREAAEALNFQLSALLYGIIGGLITIVLLFVLVGFLLIPLWIAAAIAWVVVTVVAAVKASRGEPYRYPLTIRFINP